MCWKPRKRNKCFIQKKTCIFYQRFQWSPNFTLPAAFFQSSASWSKGTKWTLRPCCNHHFCNWKILHGKKSPNQNLFFFQTFWNILEKKIILQRPLCNEDILQRKNASTFYSNRTLCTVTPTPSALYLPKGFRNVTASRTLAYSCLLNWRDIKWNKPSFLHRWCLAELDHSAEEIKRNMENVHTGFEVTSHLIWIQRLIT